jgi:DNA-binding transcriptional MerR regulator
MNLFSISELQQFSGIKAHTIRVWEQRYNALNPTRSEGNTRYYDNAQLRRLLNIVSLMESDYKVSELCSMTDRMLFKLLEEKLKETKSGDELNEYYVSQLIAAATAFDELHFEKIFSNCLLRLGMRNTYLRVIYPLLNRIGLMWAADTICPAYEHFSSNIIRQKIFSAIDSLPPAKSSRHSWLLFLPENEFHEIGLLFSHYLLRQAGKKVIYLGSNVPFETLIDAVEKTTPGHLLFFLVHHAIPEDSQSYINRLKRNFGKIKIHLSGNEKLISKLKTGKECNWIHSVEELEKQAGVI